MRQKRPMASDRANPRSCGLLLLLAAVQLYDHQHSLENQTRASGSPEIIVNPLFDHHLVH